MNIRQRTVELTKSYLSHNPKQLLLWWDSLLSVGFYMALLLLPVTIVSAAFGALIGLLRSQPLKGATAGANVIMIPATFIFGFIFGAPLALISIYTRKYKNNTEIDRIVAKFKSISNDATKEAVINHTFINDNANNTGFRSIASGLTRAKLRESDLTIDKKWQQLHGYLTVRDGAAYYNNGKKFFDAALQAVDKHGDERKASLTPEQEIALKKLELAILCTKICNNNLSTQGICLFSTQNVIPTGILKLRQCLTDNGISTQSPADGIMKLSAEDLTDLTTQLRIFAESRGPAVYFRSKYTDKLYTSICNAGYNSIHALSLMGINHDSLNKLLGEKKLTFTELYQQTTNEIIKQNNVFGYGRAI